MVAHHNTPVHTTAGDNAHNRLVGERLRWLRQERRMTLEAVELLSHGRYTPGAMRAYERGEKPLTVETAAELAWLYGVPLGGLLEASPPSAAAIGHRAAEQEHPMSNRPEVGAAGRSGDDPGEPSVGNGYEAVPHVRDTGREPQFFDMVRDVFPAHFRGGAGVLLGSYDSAEAGF